MIVGGCTQVENYFRPEPNEVEKLYHRGQEAEAAKEYKKAFKYYLRAHKLAKERQGIIYFSNPSKNNYPNTFNVLYNAMDAVGKNIDATGNWQSPKSQKKNEMQKEMFERMQLSRTMFAEAEDYVKKNDYVAAMGSLDQIITAYPYSGEADKARLLKLEHNNQLAKYREQLLNRAEFHYKRQEFELAKQTFDQLFATHPDTPEAAKAKAKIKSYILQIEKAAKTQETAN